MRNKKINIKKNNEIPYVEDDISKVSFVLFFGTNKNKRKINPMAISEIIQIINSPKIYQIRVLYL